jgi:hypothetical protein
MPPMHLELDIVRVTAFLFIPDASLFIFLASNQESNLVVTNRRSL